jgi:CRP/FNR family transcriptional regulator, cyclic AMP receptor protein
MLELVRKYHTGAYVFREGEDGDYAFLVRTGKLRLCCQRNDDLNTLEDLHEGRLFGESAFVERAKRTSAALAVAETECYAIPRNEFLGKLMNLPGDRQRALRNMLTFVVRAPMFDARGVRMKPNVPDDILRQLAALNASDLVLSLAKSKEPLIALVADQLRFEIDRRLPREMRHAAPELPPVALGEKLKTQSAPAAPQAPLPPRATPAAAPAAKPAAKPQVYSSFDMRKI